LILSGVGFSGCSFKFLGIFKYCGFFCAAGFGHKTQPGSIDLNSVRLCFQVFLEGPEKGQFKIPLRAVVSDPIYDKSKLVLRGLFGGS
jgi:hypothetical protein